MKTTFYRLFDHSGSILGFQCVATDGHSSISRYILMGEDRWTKSAPSYDPNRTQKLTRLPFGIRFNAKKSMAARKTWAKKRANGGVLPGRKTKKCQELSQGRKVKESERNRRLGKCREGKESHLREKLPDISLNGLVSNGKPREIAAEPI